MDLNRTIIKVNITNLFGQTDSKVNRCFEIHSLPVSFKKNTQFLGSSKSKDWDENFTSTVDAVVNFFEKITFSTAFRVSDSCGIC